MNKAFFAGALVASVALGMPAQAAIVLANPSAFNGEEVVFNDVDAITTGTKLLGFTNQTHTGYFFEGTTSDNTGLLSGEGGLGQATITPLNDTKALPVYITGLSFYRQDGGLFNDTEFRFVSPIADSIITLFAYDQNNKEYNLGALTLGGDNRFGLQGINGDLIKRVSYTIADGGGIEGHKQTRLDSVIGGNDLPGPVPEPATWAMMLVGFGAVGFAMRRQRQQPQVRFAF